jgi:hypothetical protein
MNIRETTRGGVEGERIKISFRRLRVEQLQGQTPGVQITATSGQPGEAPQVRELFRNTVKTIQS